jgi:transposase-like protein
MATGCSPSRSRSLRSRKELGVSENTYHRWRNQFGGMKADDVKRLRELERENQRLKRIVANQALDIDGLREIARGNF